MLVVEDKNYTIFYTKYLKPIDRLLEMEKKGKMPIKEVLMVANTQAEIEDDCITIKFIRDNIKKGWVFRFKTVNLALKWFVLYKDLYEKSIAKSLKSKSKATASDSSFASEYASILSQNRYYESEGKKALDAYATPQKQEMMKMEMSEQKMSSPSKKQ
jgi:hypothetical protein